MPIITIGIDLAKNIFAVHGVNENGQPALDKPKISRDQLLPLIANLPPCTIGWRAYFGNTATPPNPWRQSLSRPTA